VVTAGARRAIACLALALASCDPWSVLPLRSDTAYCDEQRPCKDPSARCDLTTRSCTTVATGDMAGLPDGAAAECADGSRCSEVRPVCAAGRCRACMGSADDAACRARAPATPRCGAGGGCVACTPATQAADCPTSRPVCDATLPECRRCAKHEECATGVCLDDGSCAGADSIYLVDNGGMSVAQCRGGRPAPDGLTHNTAYCEIGDALAAPNRRTNIVVYGTGYGGLRVDGGKFLIVGVPGPLVVGQVALRGAKSSPAVSVNGNASDVTLDGMFIGGGTASTGVYCYADVGTAHLAIRNSWIAGGGGNSDALLVDLNCDATLGAGTVLTQGNVGLHVTGGNATASGASVKANAVGALVEDSVLINDVPGTLVFDASDATANSKTGITCAGTGTCTITNSVIAQNGGKMTGTAAVVVGANARLVFDLDTVAYNVSASGPGGIDCSGSPKTLRNSIFFGNSAAGGSQLPAGITCSPFYTVTGAGDTLGRAMTPTFAGMYDFHLKPDDGANVGPNGCCVDKAFVDSPPAAYAAHDHDLKPRPLGSGYDIGAFEAK
jgi:hypothetical protein